MCDANWAAEKWTKYFVLSFFLDMFGCLTNFAGAYLSFLSPKNVQTKAYHLNKYWYQLCVTWIFSKRTKSEIWQSNLIKHQLLWASLMNTQFSRKNWWHFLSFVFHANKRPSQSKIHILYFFPSKQKTDHIPDSTNDSSHVNGSL